MSIRTEEAYVSWTKRYVLFFGKRHPRELGEKEVEAFLTHLAVRRNVARSTQNQAFNALLFLYRHVLGRPLAELEAARAKRKPKLPVVLSEGEVQAVLEQLTGVDFSRMEGGVRGKYYEAYREGTNIVVLDPDVADAFPTGEAVNRALRSLIGDEGDAPAGESPRIVS